MKKLLFSAIVTLLTINAFAQSFEYDGITYTILNEADKTCELTNGKSASGDISIPNSILLDNKNYTVTSIGNSAFRGCSALTSISIPNSVTSIGDWAFSDCSALTSISIPYGVTSIGYYAFIGCSSLTSISIPNSVTSIGNSAFRGCSALTSISIPNSVTSIGNRAFHGCSALTSISIPNSVTSIGNWAFHGCSALTSINVEEGCSYYASQNGVLFSKDLKTLVCYPGGREGEYKISGSVTSIGDNAFYNCSLLTSISIPNSVTSIGSSAFSNCSSLTSISIPNSVTSIGSGAFTGCGNLIAVNSYSTIPPICSGTLVFSGLPTNAMLCVPEGASEAYSSATGWSNFKNIIEGEYRQAFSHNDFLYDIISESNRTCRLFLGKNASGTVEITEFAEYNGKQYSVTSIGDWAFSHCNSLSFLSIPNSVTSIGDWAFSYCNSLSFLSIPNSVTSIGDRAFNGCISLYTVNCYAQTPPTCYENTLDFNDYIYLIGSPNNWTGPIEENSDKLEDWRLFKADGSDRLFYGTFVLPQAPIFRFYTALSGWDNNSLGTQKKDEAINYPEFDGIKKFETSMVKGKGSFSFPNFTGGTVTIIVDIVGLKLQILPGTVKPSNYETKVRILHVPQGTKEIYENDELWSKFEIIIDDLNSTTGIEEISVSHEGYGSGTDGTMSICNLQGQRMNVHSLDQLPAGIYIVNGQKVYVK